MLDYFGTGSVQRSDKKMVASKRKEVSVLHSSKNVQDLYPFFVINKRNLDVINWSAYFLNENNFPVIMGKTYCHHFRE